MVYFQTKNPNLGIFLRALEWKLMLPIFFEIFYGHLVYVFYGLLKYFSLPFGKFYGHLVILWPYDTLPHFGILYQEKSGNSALELYVPKFRFRERVGLDPLRRT
jgi:hypothetical protein